LNRRNEKRSLAIGVVAMALMACTATPTLTPTPNKTAAPTPTSSPLQPSSSAPANTVSVTIMDLSGWSNATLAAILYEGTRPTFVGVGSFVAKVDADPFTVTATLLAAPPFPYPQPSAAAPAYVPVGTHTLTVFVSWTLRPYNEWLPSTPINLYCEVPVTVPVGSGAHVQIADLQEATYGEDPVRTCRTDVPRTAAEAPAPSAAPASASQQAATAPATTRTGSSPWLTVLPVTLLIAIAGLLAYDWLVAEQRWRKARRH